MKNLDDREARALRAWKERLPKPPEPLSHAAAQAGFARIFARHKTVGATVGLLRAGQLVGLFPYGKIDIARNAPAQGDTLYRVASVSKLALSLVCLPLLARGVLRLDEDISSYLGFALRNPRHPDIPITLRQLLTHTAGISDTLYNGPGIRGELTLPQMFSGENAQKSFASDAPGQVFRYTNFGAGIAGCVLESACGRRLSEIAKQELFQPLGIRASFAPQDFRAEAGAGAFANGYRVRRFLPPRLAYDARAVSAAPPAPLDPHRDFTIAPGRLVTDMAGLTGLLSLLHKAPEQWIDPRWITEMSSPQNARGSVSGDSGRGLNVAFVPPGVLTANLVLGHQGVAYGQNAEAWIDPHSGDGVVLATSGNLLDARNRFVRCGFEAVAYGFSLTLG